MMSLLAGSCALLFFSCGKKEKVYGPAPSQYKARFETSKGNFIVQVHRDWAPLGADRFYELVDRKFYDDQRFFRVLKGFVVQWGISGDSDVAEKWRTITMKDDPVRQTNKRGTITFATGMAGICAQLKGWTRGGGYILAPAHNIQPDVPVVNVLAMYDSA